MDAFDIPCCAINDGLQIGFPESTAVVVSSSLSFAVGQITHSRHALVDSPGCFRSEMKLSTSQRCRNSPRNGNMGLSCPVVCRL